MASKQVFTRMLTISRGLTRTIHKASTTKTSSFSNLKFQAKPSSRLLHCSSCLKNKKLKHPVDDVYLEELYEPKSYDLDEAITTLRRNTELDYSDSNSLVYLNLGLYLRPGKKGRLQVLHEACDLPHDVDHVNKICVFADDSDAVKLALDNGAYMAGSTDIIPKILIGKESCDIYLGTPSCIKSTIMADKELVKALGKLTPRRSRGMTEDIPGSILEWKYRTIVSNLRDNALKINVVVAQIKQPLEEIKENIIYVMDIVREQQNPKHPPIIVEGAVNCCSETISFHIEEESELD